MVASHRKHEVKSAMPLSIMNRWLGRSLALATMVAAGVVAVAWAQQPKQPQRSISVDWSDPEIKTFIQTRQSNPPRSLKAGDEAMLSKLKLPVLAFDRPPGTVTRALGVTNVPPPERKIVMDDAEPVWYHIIDTYKDVTITIDADLRVQQQLTNTPIYLPPPTATAEPTVSILDERVEEGMEGLIAEYTVYRFGNVPYRITVECSRQSREFCRDPKQLLQDREVLRIISARPPQ